MTKSLIFILFIALTFSIFISCSKNGSSGGGGTSVDCNTVTNKAFAANINPIIQSTCNQPGCHAVGSTNGPGPLTNYSQVFSARNLIRTAVASGFMPQGSTLTAAQKNSITCWIDSGAPNN